MMSMTTKNPTIVSMRTHILLVAGMALKASLPPDNYWYLVSYVNEKLEYDGDDEYDEKDDCKFKAEILAGNEAVVVEDEVEVVGVSDGNVFGRRVAEMVAVLVLGVSREKWAGGGCAVWWRGGGAVMVW
ncbi:hypothetical protein Tco_1247831 [Tanacetum coccineum]